MLLAWLVFPLVLAGLSLGCGLLVAWAVPLEIPAPLLMPLGFAAISLVGQFALLGGGPIVPFAAPVVVALAVAGIGLSVPPRSPVRHVALAVAVVGAFAVFAAPFVLSGMATFGGYIKLDDTATYLAMLDRAMRHGYDVGGLPPSTYQATLATSLAYGYPLGSLVPLGIGRELVGQDLAWLWQPYLAFLAAMLASGLYQLAGGIVRSGPFRALVAVAGAQAALLYGYALWGGVKELAVAMLVVLLACLVRPTAEAERHSAVVPLALTSAAVVGTLSVGGSVWIAVPLGATSVLTVRRVGWEAALLRAAGFVACALILAVPSAVLAVEWLRRSGAFTSSGELGNLIGRLSWLQVFGIWPEGDFRVAPHEPRCRARARSRRRGQQRWSRPWSRLGAAPGGCRSRWGQPGSRVSRTSARARRGSGARRSRPPLRSCSPPLSQALPPRSKAVGGSRARSSQASS